MARVRPDTEYAAAPTPEFTKARSIEACKSLARFLNVTPGRALSLLENPDQFAAEIRRRTPPPDTQLRRRWRPGCSDLYLP